VGHLWRVLHHTNPDKPLGPDRLAVSGDPPPQFAAIRDRRAREQAEAGEDVDVMFDAPLDLAKSVCGYRHDEDDIEFVCLRPARELAPGESEGRTRGPGFLQRLFGAAVRP
jgi:hypothetical protein